MSEGSIVFGLTKFQPKPGVEDAFLDHAQEPGMGHHGGPVSHHPVFAGDPSAGESKSPSTPTLFCDALAITPACDLWNLLYTGWTGSILQPRKA